MSNSTKHKMPKIYLSRTTTTNKRPGYTLLVLLVVIAIGMLIYYFSLSPADKRSLRQQRKLNKEPYEQDTLV